VLDYKISSTLISLLRTTGMTNLKNILWHLGGRILRETGYDNQENGRRTTCTMSHTAQTL